MATLFRRKGVNSLVIAAISLLLAVFLSALFLSGCRASAKESLVGEIEKIEMKLSLDPAEHTLDAEAEIQWVPGEIDTFFFLLHNNLEVTGVSLSGAGGGEIVEYGRGPLLIQHLNRLGGEVSTAEDYDHLVLYALPVAERADPLILSLAYHGIIYDSVKVPSFSRWEIADETTGIIDPKGAFLTPWTGYYPYLPGRSKPIRFKTTLEYPSDWKGVAEGSLLEDEEGHSIFDSSHPIDGSYIVAGPYKMASKKSGDVEVAMYFYAGGEDLAQRYLDASAAYIEKYNEMLGPYAYDRFSVVENWFPTGYGMPTYTLLGSQVLRLPFIIYTSLGHEICHNWWGNGVYVDYPRGNWCEGLTVYCADYHYKEEKSAEEARQYRLDVDRDYSEYIVRGDEDDFPLKDFTERTTPGTRTIGYGKAMMVFHMVRNRIGDDHFWKSLREIYAEAQFTFISWDDFFKKFSAKGGEPLGWFKKQWVDRTGAPQLSLEHVKVNRLGGKVILEFDLRQVQDGESYRLDVPIRVTFSDGEVWEHVLRDVRGALYHARVAMEKNPVTVEIDPDFRLFRVLDPRETPPTLAGFFASENPLIILPYEKTESGEMLAAYGELAQAFNRNGKGEIIKAYEADEDRMKGRTVLRLGDRERVEERGDSLYLDGTLLHGADLAVIYATRDRDDISRTHLSIWGESPSSLSALARKLPHYGKYSYLAFSESRNIVKGHWRVKDSPLKVVVSP